MSQERHALRSETMRAHNRRLIFDLVASRGPISRSEIARSLVLSVTAVTDILGDLTAAGLIKESGAGPSEGGRRPTLIEIRTDAVCVLGLSFEVDDTKAVLTDPGGRVLGKVAVPSRSHLGPQAVIDSLIAAGNDVLSRCRGDLRLVAFGVACPGPVNRAGIVRPPEMLGWDDTIDVLGTLQRTLGVPGVIDNDANLGAIAALRLDGKGKLQDLVYVSISRGVGAGVVYQGDVYRGHTNWAGELGHIVVNPAGPRCRCGSYGCLESLVSAGRLSEYTVEAAKFGYPTMLDLSNGTELDPDAVIDAALAGDQAAVQAIRRIGEWLSIGVVNVVHLLNPEVVIIGGPMARAGRLLLEPVELIARRRLLPDLRPEVEFRVSILGADGPAVGSAVYALNLILEEGFAQCRRGSLDADR